MSIYTGLAVQLSTSHSIALTGVANPVKSSAMPSVALLYTVTPYTDARGGDDDEAFSLSVMFGLWYC